MASKMTAKMLKEQLFKNLTGGGSNNTGSEVSLQSEDPIELYNHAIKQFNAKCNMTSEGLFASLPNNWFYRFWMLRWWTRIRADSNCLFLLLSFCVSFFIGLIPYLNIVDFAIWLIVYLFYERARRVHNVNAKISPDPFKFMIYSPEVCRQADLMNAYYELPVSALGSVGLKETQIQSLKLKANGGTVIFMVYNDKFRNAYKHFGYLRMFHLVHLSVIIGATFMANFWLYPKLGISEFYTAN